MNDHPEIPFGMYCYSGGTVCPHWQKTENGARCNLLQREDYTYCGFHLIWDQVKECDINKENRATLSQEEYTARCIKEGFELRDIVCECGKEMEIWHWEKKKNEH